MLELNLKRIFKARGIDMPYKFLVKNGFVPFTAHKYKNGKVLKAGYIKTKVQLAGGGVVLVSNRNIDLVVADHDVVRV